MIKPPGSSLSKVGAVAAGGPTERVRGEAGRLLVALAQTPAQGPNFAIGESVSARLVEPLQNRQWLAVVKGSVFTLQWPAAAGTADSPAAAMPARGETLSLQVASLTPRLSFMLAGSGAPRSAGNAVAVQFSDAARSLTELVRAGERGMLPFSAAALDAMPVLLPHPNAPLAERAQALAQAIGHSGLFYESHLLAWAEGRLPQSSLVHEPQARIGPALKDAEPGTRDAASAELGAVLQRQLDALDGRPLAFAGFAWPGQAADWHIQRDATDEHGDKASGGHQRDSPAHAPAWTTQLHLNLPHLGALGAQLRVTGAHVALVMTLDNADAGALLAAHSARLSSALQATGLTLTELAVQASPEPP